MHVSRYCLASLQHQSHIMATMMLLLLAAGYAPLHAATLADSLYQPPASSPHPGDTLWADTKEAFSETLLFFSAPARFSLRDWGIFGWTLAGTGMTAASDNGLRNATAGRQRGFMQNVVDAGNAYGIWIPPVAISSGLYVTGLVLDEPGIRKAGRRVFQSALYATVITGAIKTLAGRHRPHLEEGPYMFHGPSTRDDYNSFPSGHTTIAFAVSSSLAAEIDETWATVGLYGLAGITGLSRMYSDRHWGSDVVFGAVVGTICGYGVAHLHDTPPDEAGLLVFPTMNGIAAVWRF